MSQLTTCGSFEVTLIEVRWSITESLTDTLLERSNLVTTKKDLSIFGTCKMGLLTPKDSNSNKLILVQENSKVDKADCQIFAKLVPGSGNPEDELNAAAASKWLKMKPKMSNQLLMYELPITNEELKKRCDEDEHLTVAFRLINGSHEVEANVEVGTPVVRDLLNLFTDGHFSDVTLKVQDKEFKVHRAILVTRCKYFANLFEIPPDVKSELTTDPAVINIDGIDPDTFEIFLRYIYGGKTPQELGDAAQRLVVIADKYGIETLASVCEEHLLDSVRMDNYLDLLILAEKSGRVNLKIKVYHFIKANLDAISTSDAWITFELTNVHFAYGAMKYIARM